MYLKMGGDSIQLLKTKEYLEKLGVKVDVSLQPGFDVSKYDIVHLFNITRVDETYDNILYAKKCSKKVVLSPIYWNIQEYLAAPVNFSSLHDALSYFARLPGMRKIKRVLKPAIERKYSDYVEQQRTILENSDIILPNSKTEMELLLRDFPDLRRDRIFVVPNGVESGILESVDSSSDEAVFAGNCIICVGRIHERKNQYRLIKALLGTDMPLVFVGHLANTDYAKRCEKAASRRGNVYFVGEIKHEQMGSLYARAKVHALPSWYETPGLANLEAGIMGCNLAISDRGSVKEYFGDYAYYCEPGSVRSIRDATLQAYYAERNRDLSSLIKQQYTWEVVAKKTLDCYRQVL
jgi:glycosyltransferase involved in cell wall biosynthesis